MLIQILLNGEVRNLLLSGLVSNNLPQLFVRDDDLLVLWVLQTLLLDVQVQVLGDLDSGNQTALFFAHELTHLGCDLGGNRESTGLAISLRLV